MAKIICFYTREVLFNDETYEPTEERAKLYSIQTETQAEVPQEKTGT